MKEALDAILAFAEAESVKQWLTIQEHLELQQALAKVFAAKAVEAQAEWDDKQEGFA